MVIRGLMCGCTSKDKQIVLFSANWESNANRQNWYFAFARNIDADINAAANSSFYCIIKLPNEFFYSNNTKTKRKYQQIHPQKSVSISNRIQNENICCWWFDFLSVTLWLDFVPEPIHFWTKMFYFLLLLILNPINKLNQYFDLRTWMKTFYPFVLKRKTQKFN